MRTQAIPAVITAMAQADPEAALAFIDSVDGGNRNGRLPADIQCMGGTGPGAGGSNGCAAAHRGSRRRAAINGVAGAWVESDPQRALASGRASLPVRPGAQ